jgi:hypothetical protein
MVPFKKTFAVTGVGPGGVPGELDPKEVSPANINRQRKDAITACFLIFNPENIGANE